MGRRARCGSQDASRRRGARSGGGWGSGRGSRPGGRRRLVGRCSSRSSRCLAGKGCSGGPSVLARFYGSAWHAESGRFRQAGRCACPRSRCAPFRLRRCRDRPRPLRRQTGRTAMTRCWARPYVTLESSATATSRRASSFRSMRGRTLAARHSSTCLSSRRVEDSLGFRE
jgi:hypothetical protein